MDRKELVEKLIEFASRAYGKDASEITEATNITEELGVKSMQRVALSASIENEFDVLIPVARIGNYETIGDLADFILDEM